MYGSSELAPLITKLCLCVRSQTLNAVIHTIIVNRNLQMPLDKHNFKLNFDAIPSSVIDSSSEWHDSV